MARELRIVVTAETDDAEANLQRVDRHIDNIEGAAAAPGGGLASRLDTIAASSQRLGESLTSVGTRLMASVTLPLVALGGVSVKAASDFESSFAGIRKTVDDATDAFGNLTPMGAKLAQGMRDLALTIPVNVNELNRIGEAAGQLGIKSENILGFTRVMADLSATTNLTSEQAATALARLANITQMPQDQFDRLGSTVVGLGNNFATTEAEIVEFGTRIAGAGTLAGLSEHQILAIGAAMSSVGIEAEAGGTSVQKVLNQMTESVATGGEQLGLFAAVAGMSAQEFADAYRQDPGGAFAAFVQGLGQQGDQAFATLEGLGLSNERVIRAFLSLANAGDLLTNALGVGAQAWAENMALTKEAEQRYNTFASQVALFWAQVRDVGITIGTALLPTVRDLMTAAQPVLTWAADAAKAFAGLPAPIRLTTVGLLALAAAAGPILFMAGQIALSVAALTRAFAATGLATGGFLPILRMLGTALGALTSPITLVVAAVAGLGVAWASFKGDWTRAFDVLIPPLGMFRVGIDQVREVLEPHKQLIADIATIVSGAFAIAWEHASSLLDDLHHHVLVPMLSMWEQLKGAIVDFAGTIATALMPVLTPMLTSLGMLLTIKDRLTGAGAGAAGWVSGLAESMRTRDPVLAARTGPRRTGDIVLSTPTEGPTDGPKTDRALARRLAGGPPAEETWTPHPLFDRADANAAAIRAWGQDTLFTPRQWRPFQNPQLLVPTTDWQPPMAAYPGAPLMNAPGDAAYAAARPGLGRQIGGNLSALLGELGPNVLGAIQGGGSVARTVGGTMLGGLVSGGSALGGAVSKGISGALGSTIGAALGSVVPVLGTLLGGAVGGMVGKLFGGGEAGKTQKARAGFLDEQGGFEELKRVADEVGFSLDKMMDTRRVQDFETEVRRLNDAMREHAEDTARIPEAMERWGLTLEQAGLKFQQSEMNKGFLELGEDFRVLMNAGFDFNLVAERMAPAMGSLIHTSIEMGTQVPRELEPIIAKMIELGVLTDKNGEQFTELAQIPFAESLTQGFDRLATVLNAILVQLGGVAVGFDQAAGAAANFNGVAGGVNVTLPVGSPTPLEDGPIDVVEMARGGLVLGRGQVQYFDAGGMVRNLWDRDRAYADFAPRGTDTVPAMLTPGEMVLSREMVRDLSDARHSTMPVGDRTRESASSARSGDTHVVIIKTSSIGEVMAQLPQHIALNGEVRYKLSRVLADG